MHIYFFFLFFVKSTTNNMNKVKNEANKDTNINKHMYFHNKQNNLYETKR